MSGSKKWPDRNVETKVAMATSKAKTTKAVGSSKTTAPPTKRVNARMDPDTRMQVEYWAARRDMSVNEYITEAIEFRIRWENQDYPVATMEQQRLVELVAGLKSVVSTLGNLETLTASGFKALLDLGRGDNLLTDADDGELATAAPVYGEED